MKYYSATKTNEVLMYTTWMTLENIMLKRKKPDIKGQILCNSTYKISRISKFMETGSRSEATRVWGWGGNRELLLNEYRVLVWIEENVLEIAVIVVQH